MQSDSDDDYFERSPRSESAVEEELDDLRSENEQLKTEQAHLLDTALRLSEELEDLKVNMDMHLVTEHEELNAELQAYQSLVNTMRDLTKADGQIDEWMNVSGDSEPSTPLEPPADTFVPTASLLRELGDEADMKVLSFLAVSQTLQGGNWMKAKYPVGCPQFFQDLKFHYQLNRNWLGGDAIIPSDRSVNMRFDMYFPGFPASVVAEIMWRLFSSEEHSRAMTRCDRMSFETIHEACDAKTGDRSKLFLMKNPIQGSDRVQQIRLTCRRTRRQVARSTLTIPRLGRARRNGESTKRMRCDEEPGNVDAFVVSQSSTKLFPVPFDLNTKEIQGHMIRGAYAWQEGEGSRIVVVISYPSEFLYNGQHVLSGNATYAFNNTGNVTKWFARLVEHAAGQFIQYMVEEVLHRRGRGVTLVPDSASSGEEEEEIVRVVEIPKEATEFLKGLASTTKW
jgi:hypothetical protein